MKLEKLLKNLSNYKIYGKGFVDITSIADDSRLVKKEGLFIAIKGLTVDGYDFVPLAIKNGVKIIVGEKKPKKGWLKNVIYIQVKDSRFALGVIASNFYGNPSKKLKVIGVTGTKGKTTTVHMIYHILKELGKRTGIISTVTNPGLHVTTPGCIELQKQLKEMLDEGIEYAVIEVSSHGIDQGRIAGVKFDVGVLTNIKPEHLDYHKTFTGYKETKMKFINSTEKKVICPKDTDIIIFPGEFNNLNAELAVRVVKVLGIDRKDALSALHSFKLPEGRLEEIKNNKGFRIFIDFAHTPDSLEQVLTYLISITKGKLIAVFGCAGERDKNKRPKMGEISARLADISIFTAEDPRSEDVDSIVKQITKGIKKDLASEIDIECTDDSETKSVIHHQYSKHVYLIIPERGEAISFAIQKNAQKSDTVVICGKGHEKSMAYNGIEYPWSDHEAAKIALDGGVMKIKKT